MAFNEEPLSGIDMYFTRIIDKIQYQSGAWNGIKVGIFKSEDGIEEMVGEYFRDYPNLYRTFYPFRKNEKDYALYSPSYTVTRVLQLPSCKDIGGEEPQANGFCPTDFFVPCYIEHELAQGAIAGNKYVINEPKPEQMIASAFSFPVSPVRYYPFGFVAGCIWGDDSSWKIQYLDLERVEQGIIKRDERFGYIKMPHNLTLRESIDMDDFNYDPSDERSYSVIMSIQQRFDVRTGKFLEEDPFN